MASRAINQAWQSSDQFHPLAEDEAHVWLFDLEVDAADLTRYRAILSSDEIQRAERFRFDRHRSSFIAARGFLRRVLSSYVQTAPERLVFRYNEFGKPSLDNGLGEISRPLFFNLSHSGSFAVCAVSESGELGIDIEEIRPGVMGEEIAERFFSAAEVNELRSIPMAGQAAAFFACWTRKEAYIKARGDGLSRALDSFTVSLRPSDPPILRECADDPEACRKWKIHVLPVPEGYAGTAITPHRVRTLQLRLMSKDSSRLSADP